MELEKSDGPASAVAQSTATIFVPTMVQLINVAPRRYITEPWSYFQFTDYQN